LISSESAMNWIRGRVQASRWAAVEAEQGLGVNPSLRFGDTVGAVWQFPGHCTAMHLRHVLHPEHLGRDRAADTVHITL
jgi:hypothetical protein